MENKKIKTVVGLDLSIRSAGWCIEKANGNKPQTGTIGTKLKTALDHERFLKIYDTWCQIKKFLEKQAFDSDTTVFCVEDYVLNSFGSRSIIDLAELGGLVRAWLLDNDFTFYLVTPGTWKKFIHKGNMRKPKKKSEPYEVGVHVHKKYGKEFETTDEVDAYAMVKFIKVLLNLSEPLDEKQELVIDKYRYELNHGKPKKTRRGKKKNAVKRKRTKRVRN